jgi:biopolymer transport protein ExbB
MKNSRLASYLLCCNLVAGLSLALSCTAWAQQAETATEPQATAPAAVINPLKTRDELQTAYQKEYAFLDAQLKDLQARQAEFEATSAQAQKDKQDSIDRIEGEYIAAQTRSERINEMLQEAERQVAAAEDSRNTLEATYLQAAATLESLDQTDGNSPWNFNPETADSANIASLFDTTFGLLQQQGRLRTAAGSFFLADGTEVQGTIIKIGNIAAFGVSGEKGGALAPAGDGHLKVWSASDPQTAQTLASGGSPGAVKIFLYESSQKAIEEQAGKTVLSVIKSGGLIAWIIVGLGVLAGVLIILRSIFLRNASASTGRVQGEIGTLVAEGELEGALKACKELKGSTSRVVASAVRNLERDRAHIEDIVSEQILHESAHLNRFGAFILVIAGVAPLLGLLGTVTGMITTFDVITEFGTGDPKLLSGGISIALVTTEVGLAVAIPALIFGNLLSGWAESIKDEMEKAALHVINLYTIRKSVNQAA